MKSFVDLGVKDAFDFSRADFSGMTSNYQGLHLNDVIHQANINVNEFGVEAAASTILTALGGFYDPDITTFNCSRPFMFVIHDTVQFDILFIGKFTSP